MSPLTCIVVKIIPRNSPNRIKPSPTFRVIFICILYFHSSKEKIEKLFSVNLCMQYFPPLSSLSFHCRIIYYEAQTYFILASILIPAQNIFSLFLSHSFLLSVLYMIYAFYTRAILPFMYLTRVKVQTF
jgi:hypothetical protein